MKRAAQEILQVARRVVADDESTNPIPMPESINTEPVLQETNIWYMGEGFETEAYDLLLSRLVKASEDKQFELHSLGETNGWPIFIAEHYREKTVGPNILVISGTHGEEQAGPWGVVRYMEIMPAEILRAVNIAFIPVINPTGFRENKRDNELGESVAAGYVPALDPDNPRSIEGHILMAHLDKLVALGTDAVITLHEDGEEEEFYMYAGEKAEAPSELTKLVLGVGIKFFGMLKDKKISPPGGGTTKDGIIFNYHDGTFEDRMGVEGCKHVYCTETPMKMPMEKRIQASVALIDAMVKGVARGLA